MKITRRPTADAEHSAPDTASPNSNMQWLGFGFRSALASRPCRPRSNTWTALRRSLSKQLRSRKLPTQSHPIMPRCEAVLLLPINNTVLRPRVQAERTIFPAAHLASGIYWFVQPGGPLRLRGLASAKFSGEQSMNLHRICSNLSSLIAVVLFSCSAASAAPARNSAPATSAAATSVHSPDGSIVLTLHTDAPLGYSIAVDGKPVLLRSRLGLELADDVSLGAKPVVQRDSAPIGRHALAKRIRQEPRRARSLQRTDPDLAGQRPHLRRGGPRIQRRRRLPPHAAQATRHGLLYRHARCHGVHLSRRRAAVGGLEQQRWPQPARGWIHRLAGVAVPARQALHDEPRIQVRPAIPGADARGLRRHHRVRSAGLVRHVAGSQAGRRQTHWRPARPADSRRSPGRRARHPQPTEQRSIQPPRPQERCSRAWSSPPRRTTPRGGRLSSRASPTSWSRATWWRTWPRPANSPTPHGSSPAWPPGELGGRPPGRTTSTRSSSTSSSRQTWTGPISSPRSATNPSCPIWSRLPRNAACASGSGSTSTTSSTAPSTPATSPCTRSGASPG